MPKLTTERREAPTGSVRDNRGGKGRFDLLPWLALWELARHFERGGLKYGDDNWRKGQPLSWYIDSAVRHLVQFSEGLVDDDHPTPKRHLVACAWNVLCLLETLLAIEMGALPPELNDLPRANRSAKAPTPI